MSGTSGLELPAHERRWVNAATGLRDADEVTPAWNVAIEGVVLKQHGVTGLTNLRSGEIGRKTETIEVTSLEELEAAEIPGGTFTPPNCRRVKKKDLAAEAGRFIKAPIK